MRYSEVLVVGAGLAGLRAAIGVNQKNHKALVLSKVHPLRSHSIAAQGGVNAALGNHDRGVTDSPERHAFDTVKGSDYLADQDAALRMCEEAPKRIYELEHWGCPFSRTIDGKIAQRPFGGAGFPRTCYAADRTGHVMLHTLYEQAVRFAHLSERQEMQFLDEWMVTRLVVDGGGCRGAVAMNLLTGAIEGFLAEAVIFGTGGAGRMYAQTTNALINSAHGMALGYWAGVPLKDMEFIQFHPTTLYGTNILMTEGCRGEGGFLTNADGKRFLADYPDSAKAMEIAPRDITARNMTREILAGRGVKGQYINLDLRHLGAEKIMSRLPGIREIAMNFVGVDPITAPIPVIPAQHYTMGGLSTNIDGETEIPGLYAAGEGACVSVHGGNRLGGNSLLDTIVFGAIAGWKAADHVEGKAAVKQGEKAVADAVAQEKDELEKLRGANGAEDPAAIRDELGQIMLDHCGIFRERAKLAPAVEKILELKERFKHVKAVYRGTGMNPELTGNLELKANLDVAEVVVKGALAREESRGSHFRTDFPQRDDGKFLKHTIARYVNGAAQLESAPVTLGKWEPKERKY
ncbi:MAG TPA: FAD-binding protein [Polyangia bacterium]|jgi:succinate dehydrogenase / fumarate reductase flavoprotein subunit